MLPEASFEEKQRRSRMTPSTIQGPMMLPSSINPSRTLPATFNCTMATTSWRPCKTWLRSKSLSPPNPPDSLIPTIPPGHCPSMTWTCISGNAPSQRLMTTRTPTTKLWQKPLSSFFISALRLSRTTSKLLPPLFQFAVLKMSSDFSSKFKASVTLTMLKLKPSWPPWPPTNGSSPTTKKTVLTTTHIIGVETIKTYGGLGSVGVIPTFLKAKIIEMANDQII